MEQERGRQDMNCLRPKETCPAGSVVKTSILIPCKARPRKTGTVAGLTRAENMQEKPRVASRFQ